MGKALPIIRDEFTTEILSVLYDTYYEKADAILKKYNPCKISEDGKTCAGGTPCCDGDTAFGYCKHERKENACPHLGETGCTVNALYCKVWLCETAKALNPECAEELVTLVSQIRNNHVPMGMRADKEESFMYYHLNRQ